MQTKLLCVDGSLLRFSLIFIDETEKECFNRTVSDISLQD